MSANLTLILVAGVLVATGVHLIFERTLSRVILGIVLASNGVGVLYLAAGGAAGR